MKISNRSNHWIYWGVFNRDDVLARTGHGIARLGADGDGTLNPGETAEANGSGGVQIEIRTTFDPGIKLPGAASYPPVAIYASPDNIIDERYNVVYTAERKLVVLDDRFNDRVGLVSRYKGTATTPPVKVDITKVVRSVLAIAEALVSNSWTHAPTKWTQGGLFKVAFALVDIFGPTAQASKALDVTDIEAVVQQLIDKNEARLLVPDIDETVRWLDLYVEHSRGLAQGATNPSTVELSAYDRERFIRELENHVTGVTNFTGTMAKLRSIRDIRKHVIPHYLLGAMLHLHLEVLNLCVKRESTPLHPADINSVVYLAESYERTLFELDADYLAFCREWAKEYPLIVNGFEYVGRTDITRVDVVVPVEGLQLAQAAVVKWLHGDRMLIDESTLKLSHFISAVRAMPVGV